MKKRKVLIINTTDMGLNGISSVIMNYFERTYEAVEYDFVLCGKVEEKIIYNLKKIGCNISISPCSRVRRPLTYYLWLKKMIKKNDYDVVHVHGNSGTMYIEMHAAKIAGVSIRVAHSHSTSCKYKLAHWILKPLLNKELTTAIACSDVAGEWIFNQKYVLVPNGINVDKFAFSQETRNTYRDKLGIQAKHVIGHVANMSPEKNHIFLLQVFELFLKERPDSCLLLIGEGILRPEIERFIKEHDLKDKVKVLGKRDDVNKLYQCMDIFVLPSVFEGFPVSLVEAQSSGLYCIVSKNVTEQVNITNKMKFIGINDSDIILWKESICEVLDEILNIDRQRDAEVVRKSKLCIDKCVDVLLGIYNQ